MPFEPMPKSDLSYANPTKICDSFQASLQPQTKQLQSVTFRFFGKEMVGLGVLDVDTKANTFKLACSTLSGAKLFDLQGNQETITADNSAPAFGEHSKEIAQAVGRDVQNIYFSLTPGTVDKTKHRKYKLTLTQKLEGGRIEYDFAGYDRQLVEKRVYEGRKCMRRINYFDYKKGKGGIYAKGIVLKNSKFHYRLIIRAKQEL